MNARSMMVVVVASLSVGACELITDPGCDVCSTSAVVRGTVTAEGAVVAGAEIWISLGITGCSNEFSSGAPEAVSAADGTFELLIVTGLSPAERCVILVVVPLSGTGLAAQRDTVSVVRFRADQLPNASRDTVEHHVTLLPTP